MLKQYTLNKLQRTCEKESFPNAYCAYLAQSAMQPSRQLPIAEARLVVFDTETTGLNLNRDRLLSIGAVVVQGGEIRLGDSFELLVNNETPSQRTDSILVHGLRPSETRAGQEELDAVMAFLSYLGPDIVVAHHAGFDLGMVTQVMHRHISPKSLVYNRVLDTATLAKRLISRYHTPTQQGQFGLDALCERYSISREDRHTAWGDALITAKLLLKLLHLYEQKGKCKVGSLL